MQFIENGCDIPEELLEAHAQGKVVFFCGAGVSKAKANLPDFIGLTREVLTQLHVPSDHKVAKLLDFIADKEKNQGKMMGYKGLVLSLIHI